MRADEASHRQLKSTHRDQLPGRGWRLRSRLEGIAQALAEPVSKRWRWQGGDMLGKTRPLNDPSVEEQRQRLMANLQ